MVRQLICLVVAALVVGAAPAALPAPASTAARTPPPAPIAVDAPFRAPMLQVAGAEQPISLRRLKLDVEMSGGVTETRVQMEFFNPNRRVLEGKLQFPLRGGQVVTGFALDIDGQLREAVPVEKARAQQVFEDIARRSVDPGLLQTTIGNNYELRIYPLRPGQTRSVVLTIAEPAGRRVQVPLAYAEHTADRVADFELSVRVPAAGAAPAIVGMNPLGVRFERAAGGGYALTLRTHDSALPAEALVIEPANPPAGPLVTTQILDRDTFFTLALPVPVQRAERPLPARVQIVWDASASGAARQLDRELALLDAYFKRAGTIDASLVRVADVAAPAERFAVRRGDWSALRRALQATVYDGASNLGAVVHDGTSQEALVFSDGLANYGAPWALAFPVPVFTVNSAAASNPAALQALAEASGGTSIDLTRLSAAQAAAALLQRGSRLVDVSALGARDVVVETASPADGRLSLAGVLSAPSATLTLRLRGADGLLRTETVRIDAARAPSRLAAGQWARIKLAQLGADEHLHRLEIRAIGKRFGIATGQTSLLVLERVEDYVQYEIEPPLALRNAYGQLLAAAQGTRRRSDAARLAELVQRFQARTEMWSREFPKGAPPIAATALKDEAVGAARLSGQVQSERDRSLDARETASTARRATAPPASFAALPAPSPAAAKAGANETTRTPSIEIALKPARSDAPTVKRLLAADPKDWQAIYLDERRDNAMSVGFYLDVAEFFFAHGRRADALRILSNLAEMDLQNRQVLRLLAYRLAQADAIAFALPVFERVLELAPNEPQSHRDLGLALAQAGREQAAIERLYETVVGSWDGRFPDIDLIALAELNAVHERARAAGRSLDVSAIDARLLRNLPFDIRVVLAWDADNTDVDLHVIDPNGEEVYYGHRASYQGGSITRDATGGYGPEEFTLKAAKPGRYRIEAEFYGHRQQILTSSTGLMMWLSSGFGTAQQRDQRSTLRVKSEHAERVVVGEFEVKR